MVVQDLVYRISATNTGLKTVVRDSQQSIRSLMDTADKSVRSLENMSRKMRRTGTILFTGMSALTKKTIDSAASFEKSMRRVQAVSQATTSEYQKLSAAALEMSTRTEHSAMAVAEGMNFMAMAGFKAKEIMEAMPSVLQLASAGVMDLGTAADITTNILTGYGMEISELAKANDILVSAMTGANVDLQMLGESFKYAGPLAKAAGIEFSETAAMIALMGNAGIQGSMAGTSLRQAITNLLNPTKQARDVMDRLGVKTRDANDNLLSMTEILRQLEDRGASASDMMILFGQRAGPAMSALLGQGVDELEKFQQRLEDAEGLATRIEAMMVDTAEGQKTIFKNTVNAIRIMFGQDMIPYYRTAVFFLQGIADRIKQMEPQQRMQIIRITAITGAVVGLVAVLGFLGTAIAGIIKGFLAFGSAIMFLMSMKGLAIGAIILAVGLLKKAWDSDFGGIKTKTEEVWKVVGPVLEDFWEILQRSWTWTINIAKDVWDWIINTTWAEKWEDIKGWLDATWEWTINIGTDIKEWIFNTTWTEKWEDIKGWFDTAWEWTVNLLGDAWEWLEKHAPWLTTTLETLWGYVEEAWTWTVNKAIDAWEWLDKNAPWLTATLTTIKNLIADTWNWAVDIAQPVWDWIIDTTWAEKWEDIKGWLDTTWNWAITIDTGIKEWIFNTTWADKWEDIKSWIDDTWDWTVNLLGDAWEWLEENAPWLTTTLETLWGYVGKAWTWTVNKAIEAWEWLEENAPWLTDTLKTLKGLIADTWKWTIYTHGTAWDWLTETTWVDKVDDVKSLLSEAWEWTITPVGNAFKYIMESDFGVKLEELRKKITDSKLWQWTIDVTLPAILEGGEIVLKAIVEAGGKMYDAIKKGLNGEGWGDFWDVTEDIWSTGVVIAVSLKLAATAGAAILTAIGTVFGNAAGTLGVGGVPLAIGLLTVGIQLAEAFGEGHFADFAENVLFAALSGVLVGLAFDPALGMLAFNVALNLKLGENIIGTLSDQIQYLQYMLENMSLVDILLGRNHPEDMMSFEEWLYWRETGKLPGEPTSGVFVTPGPSGSYDDIFGTGTAFPTSPFESYTKEELDLILKAREGDVKAIQRLATEFGRYPKPLPDEEEPSISQADLISIASRYSAPSYTSIENISAMQKFFEQGGLSAAQKAANALGIPVEWILAQWALETSYFQSELMDVFNLGGVKAAPGEASVKKWTWEEVNGKKERVLADFKAYESIDEYVEDWVDAIGKKWKHAIGATTLEEYIAGLTDPSLYSPGEGWIGKYATDSNYLKSVEDVLFNIERYMAFDTLEDMAAEHGYDYVSHFVNGVANGAVELSEEAAKKFVQLVQRWIHDISANDATAFRWGKDFVAYFVDGIEEEALNQQARMEEIASRMLMPMTFDNPENDAWIFGSGVDLVQWFGKGISSAAQGVVEIVKMLIDALFNAISAKIAERYPELLEFFNSLKEEVDEGIKAVEEFVAKLGGDDEGEKAIKELDAVTTSWLQNLSNGLASAIVHGESLYDVFDNLLRMIAQQALSGFFMRGISSILSKAGYSVPTMHFGGLVMHSGGMIEGLRPDEVPIIAQKGERVLSRKQNDQFEQMLEDFTGAGWQNINLNIYANDAKSFVDMVRRNPEAIVSVLVDDYQGNGIIRRLVRG